MTRHSQGDEANGDDRPRGADQAAAETPLPWRKVIPILVLLAAESFNGVSIFSYITMLVMDFKPELRGEDGKFSGVGYYAGVLAANFFIGQFISSFIWGKLSDKHGRRPILLLGALGSLVCAVAFCFTRWYWFSVLVRLLSGILNGNLGVVKTYLGEITDSTNQARAFSWFSLIQGVFGIIGGLSGGFLARPAIQYPSVFASDGFFSTFPYFLANSISACLLLAGLVLSYFFLTENDQYQKSGFKPLNDTTSDLELEETGLAAQDDEEPVTPFVAEVQTYGPVRTWLIRTLPTSASIFLGLIPDPTSQDDWTITKDTIAILAIVVYSLLGFLYVQFDETYPVWTVATIEAGGLGFETQQNGITAAVGGVSVVVIQTLLYRPIATRLGSIRTLRAGLILSIPTFLSFPLLNLITKIATTQVFWICLCVDYFLRNFAAQLSFTAIIQMVNNSALPSHMARVNGVGQSLVAMLRAISPLVGGSITAWSLENGLSFPFNAFFPFFCLAAISGGILALSWKLPASLMVPKAEFLAEEDRKQLQALETFQDLAEQD